MSNVTITSGPISTYQGDEELELRAYYSHNFSTSTGDNVVGSSSRSSDFYVSTPCSVDGNGVVSHDTFVVDSTVDALANSDDSRLTLKLFTTSGEPVKVVAKGLQVPVASPTSIATIAAYNAADTPVEADETYTKVEIDAIIAEHLDALTDDVVEVTTPQWEDFVEDRSLEEFGNSLVNAHAAIGSTPTRLIIAKPTTLSVTKDFPATCRFVRRGTGHITVAAGQTLTIRSMQDPGSVKFFTLANSSTSHVRFSDDAVAEINTAWWTGPGGGDITTALKDAIASTLANAKGAIYTPCGTWTSSVGEFDYPAYVNHRGDGKGRTIFQNNSDSYWMGFAASVIFNYMSGFSIKGVMSAPDIDDPDLADSNTAIKWYGGVGESNGFQSFHDVSVATNHIGLSTVDTGGDRAFNVNNVVFDHTCEVLSNDINTYSNTYNNDIEIHGYFQAQWIRTGGDYTSPVGYSQHAGVFDALGRIKITRELAGLSSAYNPGGGSTFNGYGNNQVQQIIIDNADNVTVGGTALVTVKNANMVGDSGLGSNRVVSVPLTTAHNTGALIAAAIRQALADDAQVSSAHHVAYNRIDATGPREINLIYLDPAATDTMGALSIDPNGVVGLSTYASSTRLPGKVSYLPKGFLFRSAHSACTFALIDEGYEYSIKNDADDDTAMIVLNGATIQSPIVCRKKCTLVLNGGTYASQSIRDGGTDNSTFFGPIRLVNNGATVAYYSNFWLSTGQSIQNIVNRRVHNFDAGNDIARKSGLTAVDIDHVNSVFRTAYRVLAYRPHNANTIFDPEDVMMSAVASSLVNYDTRLFGFGAGDNLGKLLFGYYVRREGAGSSGFPTDFLGWAKWFCTQAGAYKGWKLDFPLMALGLLSNSPTQPSGYADGAGGTVAQETDKTATVVISKPVGQITMEASQAINAGAIRTFTVTNTLVKAADIPRVVVAHSASATDSAYFAWAHSVKDGEFKISVQNISGGNLSEPVLLNFDLGRGATV